jgi:hypothetical protein
MEKFTFEELALMRIFDTANREALRDELIAGLHDADEYTEPELISLFGTTLEKLDTLTDEEFAALSIYLDVEDFYTEDDAIDG